MNREGGLFRVRHEQTTNYSASKLQTPLWRFQLQNLEISSPKTEYNRATQLVNRGAETEERE